MEQENKDEQKKPSKARKITGGAIALIGLVIFFAGFFIFSTGAVFGWFVCLAGMIVCIVGSVISGVKDKVSFISTNIVDESKKGDTVTIGDNDELYIRKCTYCGAQNSGTAKFCNNCGREFTNVLKTEDNKANIVDAKAQPVAEPGLCQSCGGHNEKDDKFCRFCGKKL